jgi:uncharacterized protein
VVKFTWDPRKDRRNQSKHGVSFAEASTVFDDRLAWTVGDPDHSIDENRYLTTGYSDVGRLLIVAHTEDDDDRIRIINARPTTNAERNIYEQGD